MKYAKDIAREVIWTTYWGSCSVSCRPFRSQIFGQMGKSADVYLTMTNQKSLWATNQLSIPSARSACGCTTWGGYSTSTRWIIPIPTSENNPNKPTHHTCIYWNKKHPS